MRDIPQGRPSIKIAPEVAFERRLVPLQLLKDQGVHIPSDEVEPVDGALEIDLAASFLESSFELPHKAYVVDGDSFLDDVEVANEGALRIVLQGQCGLGGSLGFEMMMPAGGQFGLEGS